MNEEEWKACEDPGKMLEFIRGKVSERKLRLFAVACCRRLDRLVTPERLDRVTDPFRLARQGFSYSPNAASDALAVAERMAEEGAEVPGDLVGNGPCEPSGYFPAKWGLSFVVRMAERSGQSQPESGATGAGCEAVLGCLFEMAHVGQVIGSAADAEGRDAPGGGWSTEAAEGRANAVMAGLLRCVAGNPFRPVALDPSWVTSAVTALSNRMYESRDFSLMPILADALEDGGCESDAILGHCRDPHAVHCKGCWVLDLLTGRS